MRLSGVPTLQGRRGTAPPHFTRVGAPMLAVLNRRSFFTCCLHSCSLCCAAELEQAPLGAHAFAAATAPCPPGPVQAQALCPSQWTSSARSSGRFGRWCCPSRGLFS